MISSICLSVRAGAKWLRPEPQAMCSGHLWGIIAVLLWTLGGQNLPALAQPYGNTVFSGISAQEGAGFDPVNGRFCWAVAPLRAFDDSTYRPELWQYLPDQRLDDRNPNPISRTSPRGLGSSVQAISTPPGRHWFVSSGTHIWDSTGRRVSVYPMANRHARFGGADVSGTYGFSQALVLPVRDTPGVFRQLVFDYSPGPHWRFNYARGSFDRIVLYRLDARVESEIPETMGGSSGNGRHLRIYPEPVDTTVPDLAVAWSGGPNAYSTDSALRQPLATLSRMVAVAHGNGRDWWIICTGGQSSPRSLAVFLLNEQGLYLRHHYPNALPFTPGFQHYYHSGMQLAASQQGDLLALHATPQAILVPTIYGPPIAFDSLGISLWDFDRCSGEVFGNEFLRPNYRPTGIYPAGRDGFPSEAIRYGNGVGFSPSAKWLYYSESTYIARFNLSALSVEQSEQLILAPDSVRTDCYGIGSTGGPISFLPFSILANGTLVLNPGASCRIQTAVFDVDVPDPTSAYGGFSVLPTPCLNANRYIVSNLNLWDAPGASCDTLGVDGWAPTCLPFRPRPDTVYLCEGSSTAPDVWRGQTLDAAGRYVYRVQEARGCDSLWAVDVISVPMIDPTEVRVVASPGDSVGGVSVRADTSFAVTYQRQVNGCDSVVRYVVSIDPNAVNDPSMSSALLVYPNPLGSGGQLSIELPEGSLSPAACLEIVDVLGHVHVGLQGDLISRRAAITARGSHRLAIDTNGWAPGTYLIRYTTVGRGWRTWVVVL